VYPANFLKGKIIDWQKDRIEKCLEIGEKHKSSDEEKFMQTYNMAHKIVKVLGEDTYKTHVKKVALLMHSSKFLSNQSSAEQARINRLSNEK